MPISNYPNGFSQGVSILGMPVLNSYAGSVFWVNSNGGSDGNKGTRERAFGTLDYAIGKCTANKGDIILVAPNHAETITGASGITFDVAGITVVGMGNYNQRPRFLMDGGTTVTAVISAADVTLSNMVFASGHADVVTCFGVTAVGSWFDQIEFSDNAANENWLSCIKGTGTTDNEADGMRVTNCRWVSPDAGGLEMIEWNSDVSESVLSGNTILCDGATACKLLLVATGKSIQEIVCIDNNVVIGNTAGDLLIDNDSADNTGIVANNLIGHHDTASEVLVDIDGVRQFGNLGTATDTASGYVLPAIDS
jgi:hypothetical protein|tara:strand:+ start:1360 stop:2286 length:927 start_codon:yes stop_codon:yes gene_type:complete